MRSLSLVRHATALMALACFALVASAPNAQAQTVFSGVDDPRGTFTNSINAENQFKAALTLFGTETVESLAGGTNDPTLTFGSTGITAATTNTIVQTSAALAVSGVNNLGARVATQTFTFNAPVQGFGAFFISLGNFAAPNTLTLTLDNTILGTSETVNGGTFGPNASVTNVAYVGVIDAANPFNRVTVQTSNRNDGYGFDNLTAGIAPAAVPEPGSIALLMGLSLSGAAFLRRRKAVQNTA